MNIGGRGCPGCITILLLPGVLDRLGGVCTPLRSKKWTKNYVQQAAPLDTTKAKQAHRKVPAKVWLKAGEVLGRLGDNEYGLHDEGSHLEPWDNPDFLLESPSYSDISLSEVGSHLFVNFLGLNWGVGAELLLWWVVSWYTGISMSTDRLGGSITVFLGTGISPDLDSPGKIMPNS